MNLLNQFLFLNFIANHANAKLSVDFKFQSVHVNFLNLFHGCTLTFQHFALKHRKNISFNNRYYFNELYVVASQSKYALNLHFIFSKSAFTLKEKTSSTKGSLTWHENYNIFSKRNIRPQICQAHAIAIPQLNIITENTDITNDIFPNNDFILEKSAGQNFIQAEYLVILATGKSIAQFLTEKSQVHFQLPDFIKSIKSFISIYDNFSKNILVNLGCYSCTKYLSRGHRPSLFNWNTVSLKPYPSSIYTQLILLNIWNHLHQKLHNFGNPYRKQKYFGDSVCFKRYNAYRIQSSESDCTRNLLMRIINCTESVCVSGISYGNHMDEQINNYSLKVIPFGVEYQGYKYATVLGLNEDDSSNASDFGSILRPFEYQVWILILISMVVIRQVCKCFEISSEVITYWIF